MIKLIAEKRDIFGKKLKQSRVDGKLPVVVYGATQKEPLALFVNAREFKRVLTQAGESTVVSVEADQTKADVLIHQVDFHPVTDEPIHADLLVIDKTKTVEIGVPLRFEGVSPAVKDLGATLVKVLHELEVEVLPMDIPRDIEVDISVLVNLDSQILVKELKVSSKVKVLNDPEEVVASIAVMKEEPAEAPVVDLADIEVEKKGKKEEEGAESTATTDQKEAQSK